MAKDKKYDFLRQDDNPYRPYYMAELEKQKSGDAKKENIRDVIFGKAEEVEQEEEQEIIVAPDPEQFKLELPKDITPVDD